MGGERTFQHSPSWKGRMFFQFYECVDRFYTINITLGCPWKQSSKSLESSRKILFCWGILGSMICEGLQHQHQKKLYIYIYISTRWAPTIGKWGYNPYKFPYKWVTGVITPISRVITLPITLRGPLCSVHGNRVLCKTKPPFYGRHGQIDRQSADDFHLAKATQIPCVSNHHLGFM